MIRKLALVAVVSSVLFSFSCNKNSQCVSSAPKAQVDASGDAVVATIGGQPLTMNEFESKLSGRDKGALLKAKNQMFEAKQDALEEYVFQKLTDEEAKKKNQPIEEYLKNEIEKKVKPVNDKQVEEFYNNVKFQYEKAGKTAPPLNDAVKTQIKSQLSMKDMVARKEALARELQKKHKVEFLLQQPTVDINVADAPMQGSEKAKVTIVEFSDFQCPYCKEGSETMKAVMKKHKSKVKYYFKNYPLSFHERARPMANAALCAKDQGKFWEYHDMLFDNQAKNTEADFLEFGKTLKLDLAKFEPCVKQMQHASVIDKETTEGENVGVNGTPTYFINGVLLTKRSPENFEAEILRLSAN